MSDKPNNTSRSPDSLNEIPSVDWLDLECNRDKFFKDLRYALEECGFLILTNAPGFEDEFQRRAFTEVRKFFDSPMDFKQALSIVIVAVF